MYSDLCPSATAPKLHLVASQVAGSNFKATALRLTLQHSSQVSARTKMLHEDVCLRAKGNQVQPK